MPYVLQFCLNLKKEALHFHKQDLANKSHNITDFMRGRLEISFKDYANLSGFYGLTKAGFKA